MKSCEKFVSYDSNYFVYVASATAQKTFFYPTCIGEFFYEPGYMLRRDAYDSFLLMYIRKGNLTLEYGKQTLTVTEGHFVLLDCYQPHSYYSDTGWESIWFHFDGPSARAHYDLIHSQIGTVFTLSRPYLIINKMMTLYKIFLDGTVIQEALLSKLITDILTALLLYSTSASPTANYTSMTEEIVAYIHEHYNEDISIQQLADHAMLSQYHFIRVFKRETNYTPYEYIRNIRISTAKYMLKATQMTVKDICYSTGFSNVSVFCSAFKKETGFTPAEYRNSASPS